MDVSTAHSLYDNVISFTETAQQKGTDPLIWKRHIISLFISAGEPLPSPELAEVLVSYILWDNNVPIMWNFLEKAFSFKIVPPLLLLALLSVRFVICSFFLILAFCFVLLGFTFFELENIEWNWWMLFVCRVIPCRKFQPQAYRLYMELLKQLKFELKYQIKLPDYVKWGFFLCFSLSSPKYKI